MRILIVGRPGAGKSSLSIYLANKLNFPVFHLERYCYQKNWKKEDAQVFTKKLNTLLEKESVILEGNCFAISSMKLRFEKADLILYLNYSLWICFWRIIKRVFQYWKKQWEIQDLPEDTRKTISWRLIRATLDFRKKRHQNLSDLSDMFSGKLVEFRNDDELNRWLEGFFKRT